jgi:4-diphosphocytidyl-2-C-methyl-D-erythritol kinase
VVVPVGLADVLEFRAALDPSAPGCELSLDVVGPPALTQGVPSDESNLVLRAARALAERAGVRGFARITLEKSVPSAAGLGGGSADAAATLRALNRLWGCGLDDADLSALAARVGADVPALLHGGPVLVRGLGERVESVATPRLTWLLCPTDLEVRTADAFAWWDQDGAVTGPGPGEVMAAAARAHAGSDPASRAALARLLFNDLQASVVRRHPVVGSALDRLREAGAAAAILCGSGPTVAGLFEPLPDADGIHRVLGDLERVTGRPPAWVVSPGSEARKD